MSAHLICWTLAPLCLRFNLPMDAIEGVMWGQHLQWGYDKNPYLNGWLSAFAVYLDGYSGYLLYFFSQFCVIICLWATWKLATNILSPFSALFSVLILESIQYYNFHALDFNDNTLELALWALIIYFFYKALHDQKNRSWLLTGLFAGFAVMAKYYSLILVFSLCLFLMSNKENRKQLTTFQPYIAAIIFLVIIIPHCIWLCSHHFITIQYMLARTSSLPSWTNHIYYLSHFTWQQVEVLLPVLIILLIFCKKNSLMHSSPARDNDINFLFYAGVLPFLLTLFISFIFGIQLRAGWGMPLFSTWGIFLIASLKLDIEKSKQLPSIFFSFILMITLVTSYSIYLTLNKAPTSANFPGKEIAETITKEWKKMYHTPLAYAAGHRWFSGNISFYSPDHPIVFPEWNIERASWINLHDLQKKGGVFVWNMAAHTSPPEKVMQQFPQLHAVKTFTFAWHRNKNSTPITIGIAILPPANS